MCGAVFENMKFQQVLREIPRLVIGYDCKDFDGFTKQEYKKSLEAYTTVHRGTFQVLQELWDEGAEEAVELACERLVEEIEREICARGRRGFGRKALALEEYKMVIVVYLNPAVFRMELGISGRFVQALRNAWLKKYPGQPYQAVHEQEIAAGFEGKWLDDLLGKIFPKFS